jgi:hypothetical protein
MHPASAAPAAGSADNLVVPKTPASSLPSVDRSRTAARPHVGSVLPHTPLVKPARIVPRLSSPALCPSRQKAIYCRIFTPAQPVYPAASIEEFSLRRSQHSQSLNLRHIPGGNIATVYFRPQVLMNWNSTQTGRTRDEVRSRRSAQ